MDETKQITPLIQALILRKLGIYGSERLSVDNYSLLQAVEILIHELGEEWVKEKYKEMGKDWEETRIKLQRLNKHLTKLKTFYDPIIDKKFSKDIDEPEKQILKFFRKTASKISILQPTLYELFIFLVKNSNIKRCKIPSEAFKVPEHVGYKKISLQDKPDISSREESS